MSASITVKIDNVAGAGYIALSSEPVASTIEYSDSVMIDLDALGMVVGIEVLELDGPLPIDEIAKEFHIHSDTAMTVRRLQPTLNSAISFHSSSGVSAVRNEANLTECLHHVPRQVDC